MGKVVQAVVGVANIVAGVQSGNPFLIVKGVSQVGSALSSPKKKPQAATADRQAVAATVQLGEVPRSAIFGEAATAGSLVDAFNYGGKYGTDWEVLVLDLADHRCEGLRGFYVSDQWVEFGGDGPVAGYGGQLSVWWRPGTEDQAVPEVLLENGPGWTPDDNGAGVAHVVVAYKADAADAKEPIWPGGRPRFLWVVRGAMVYSARGDDSVGGAGGQRWDQPATRAWSSNPVDCRYTWARGLYACDRVGDPSQLMIGRGLSAIEAPPANVFHRANLCDEPVDGRARYTVGALVEASATFLDVEGEFAAACAGTIVQPQGSVEIDPGEARAAVATITDDDLVVGSRVTWNNGMLGTASADWVNTVVASYVEPALKWAAHAAPVRREVADVLADRQSREERLQLGYVTDGAQAGRIAEVRRRLGRLPGRASITLPPRFAFIEEGDWIVWHSPRRFRPRYGVDAVTFRVEAWASGADWHHQVSLRQISGSAYSDTAPLDDGSVAVLPPAPPLIGAPDAADWSVDADYQDGGDIRTPVLVVAGRSTDRAARFVRIEYRADSSAAWTDAGVTGPDVERREVPIGAEGLYYAAVSYVVDGVTGPRLTLGPVLAGSVLYPDGTPMKDRQPAEAGATRGAPVGTAVGGRPVIQIIPLLDAVPGLVDGQLLLGRAVLDLDGFSRRIDQQKAVLEAALLRVIGEAGYQRGVLRDAGVVIDPVTGKVSLYALDQTRELVTGALFQLDATKAQILTKVDASFVRAEIAAAQLNPADLAALTGVIARVTSAEQRLDALAARVETKAEAATLTALGGTVQSAVQVLDALAGEVATKVGLTEFGKATARIGTVEQIISAIGDVASFSITVRQAKAVGDAALFADIAGLAAADQAARRQIVAAAEAHQELMTRMDDGLGVQAAATLFLSTRLGEADARAAMETLVRSGQTSALAQQTGALSAMVGTLSATVTAQAKALVDESGARAEEVRQVRAEFDARVSSQVTRLDQVDADERGARAAAVQQLRVEAGDALLLVDDRVDAVVDRTGRIEATRTIAIDAGGNIVGQRLVGSTAGPGALELVNADLKMGSGRVVFDNGSVMRVQGTGFGAQRDLISWFGPTMAIAQCSRANAVSYEAADGSAYFGGSLTAGTLRNAAASSGVGSNEVAAVGPFGSNGRPVRYIASWSCRGEFTKTYTADQAGMQEYEADRATFGSTDGRFGTRTQNQPVSTITLARSFDGAAYDQLGQRQFAVETQTWRAVAPVNGDAPGSATFTAEIGGGFTVNDPAQSAANRWLRLTLARGYPFQPDQTVQRLTIVAIEE